MTRLADAPHRTVVLMLPAMRAVFAMSTAALSVAHGSRKKVIADYRDALILDRDGTVRRFDRIDFAGPVGDTGFARFVNRFLTKTMRIVVTLSEPLPLSTAELRSMLATCMVDGSDFIDPDPDPDATRQRMAAIAAAPDKRAIFQACGLPPPEDALDVL